MTESAEKTPQEVVEGLDKLHCFGSHWFCLQMQESFKAQSAILKEIAFKHDTSIAQDAIRLIHGLHTCAEAIALLRRDGLLNEANVLMRLLIERALTLCNILIASPSIPLGRQEGASREESVPPREIIADELITNARGFRFVETYDSEALELKIKAIAKNSKIPEDFLRFSVASYYPPASLAISGSPIGAICHLPVWRPENNDEGFSTLLFGGLTLLNYVIRELSKYGIPQSLISESDKLTSVAHNLMSKVKHPIVSQVRNGYGFWQKLEDNEYFATKKLTAPLREFELAFAACVEAGIDVPILAKREPNSIRLQICGLYLKRMLNDLRSVWVMMRQGNTSQSGAIAASLFENALMIQVLAENEERAIRLNKKPSGKWPWDKKSMCEIVENDEAKREKRKVNAEASAAHYIHYTWLCQIKHTTLASAAHDSGSTSVEEKGYALIPFPDVREEDWPLKRKILHITLFSACSAIKAFARGGMVGQNTPAEVAFADKLKTIDDLLVRHLLQK